MPVPIILEENHLGHATLLDMSEQQNRVLFDPIKTLSIDELPKEMSYQEVQMIYQAAEPVIKGVITLIFNGLSLAEILSLNGADLNFETMTIVIPGQI
jgi:integrase